MGECILVVDDDPDFVEAVRTILESEGFEVDAAYNPRQGMELLTAHPYALLVLDVMMGRGAEGILLARKIQKDSKLRNIPVLIVTGIREQLSFLFRGKTLKPGLLPFDYLMEKPVDPEEFRKQVKKLLEEKSVVKGR
ncbi:MAG: response regulator [bacterium JZ-2024 1]